MKSLRWACSALAVCAAAGAPVTLAQAPPQPAEAAAPANPRPVIAALDAMDAWLARGPNAGAWHAYLHADELRAELAKGAEADPAVIARAMQRFSSGANGLELGPFAHVRRALDAWRTRHRQQYAGDVARLAWAARGDHTPISPEQFDQVRAALRRSVQALDEAFARNPRLAGGWKAYLHWDDLTPHIDDNFQPTAESLTALDDVLRRFRSNEAGLELPVFSNVAKATARYRALVTWAATARTRDTRPVYERYLTDLQRTLERHRDRPTVETIRQIARVLGIVDALGQSPEFVSIMRGQFAQPNIYGVVSADLVTRAPMRPVDRVTPVRDCILGTSIFGQAHTLGGVHYTLQDSAESVQLAIHLDGEAHSRTRGFNGPVRINSTGRTTFWASSHVTLTDDAFVATPATGDADTRTRIRSIQKTGGPFGARLIEKIAWNRARQQKRQAERISSSHTRERVIREFEQTVVSDLAAARLRYENELRAPLVRRGVSPEYLRMRSFRAGAEVETLFATRHQLGAPSAPPAMMPGHDLAVQIHESAVNNYLPLALSSARIAQQSAENPPDLEGNVPNWLKLLAVRRPQVAAAAQEAIETVEQATEVLQDVVGVEPEAAPAPPPFKPYSITLNAEAPASVHFDDGQAIIRVRAASLVSEENEYQNWDFIITYQITHDENRILLKRVGEIEALPTGFDTEWPRQLSAEETGFRSVLNKNMNARANAGQSFPKEIPIDPVRISRFGVLVLRELVADNGWLTVGWELP